MKDEKMRQEQTGAVCKTAQNNLRKIDTEAIRLYIRGILQALGDDPDREGLKETPERVAKMYEEVFEGMYFLQSGDCRYVPEKFCSGQDREFAGYGACEKY